MDGDLQGRYARQRGIDQIVVIPDNEGDRVRLRDAALIHGIQRLKAVGRPQRVSLRLQILQHIGIVINGFGAVILQNQAGGGGKMIRLLLRQGQLQGLGAVRRRRGGPARQMGPVRHLGAAPQGAVTIQIPAVGGQDAQAGILLLPFAGEHLLIVIGGVNRKPAGAGLVAGGRRHRFRKGLPQRPGFLRGGGGGLLRQAAQVRQVIVRSGGGAAEAPGSQPAPGQGGEGAFVQLISRPGEKSVRGRFQRLDPVQPDQRQGQHIRFLLAFHIGGDDVPADFLRAGFLSDRGQEAVIPAADRLDLLAGDHIVRVFGADAGHLQRGHQAGVEPDPGKPVFPGKGAAFQGFPQLRQGQAVLPVQVVEADPLQRTRPVIPEDQGILRRGAQLRAQLQKPGENFRLSHALGGKALENPAAPGADFHQEQLPGIIIALPAPGSAQQRQHGHLRIAGAGPGDLLQLRRRGAVIAFQVAAAEIDHQRQIPGRGFRPAGEGKRPEDQQRQQRQQRRRGGRAGPGTGIRLHQRSASLRTGLRKEKASQFVRMRGFRGKREKIPQEGSESRPRGPEIRENPRDALRRNKHH